MITLNAKDDNYIEYDESARISIIQDPNQNTGCNCGCSCGCGCGPSGPTYSYSYYNSSATVTIKDNDKWKVSVTASKNEVIEHKGYSSYGCSCGCNPGTPEYGEFTIKRTGTTDPSDGTNVPGTTVFFTLTGDAIPGSDYDLSYTLSGGSNYSLTYGIYDYYSVSFPYNAGNELKLRVTPWNDAKPEKDSSTNFETVKLTLVTPEEGMNCGCGCNCGCTSYDYHPYKYDITGNPATNQSI